MLVQAPDLLEENVVRDSIEAWRESVSDVHTRLSFETESSRTFKGVFATTSIGNLRACKFASSALTARRTKHDVARSTDGTTIMIWQLRGESRASQGGRDCFLPAGTATFLDLDQPYEVQCSDGYGQLVMHVPTEDLTVQLRRRGVRRNFRAASLQPEGLAAPWLAFLRTGLLASQASPPGLLDALYGSSVGALAELAALAAGSETGDSPEDFLLAAAVATLRENYWRSDLTADVVARKHAVSRRTLFRAFDESGLGFAETLQDIRLETAARMLATPSSSLTVEAVGRAVGYSAPSTFYARFSTRFGISPGRYRRTRGALGTESETT